MDILDIVDGDLVVTQSPRSGNADYYLENGILKANAGFTGSITATADFNPEAQYKVINFYYDHNGLRTRKEVWNHGVTETYDYTLHGKLITHMTKRTVAENGEESTEELHFFYDAQSRPAFVEYNGTMYRYVHSLQGDIIGIVDNSGILVVEYKYDVHGLIMNTNGSLSLGLGKYNLFRYRSYCYDEEIKMYWLERRHYNPVQQRMICADTVLGGVGNLISHNIYAYSVNNSIMCVDESGKTADWFTSAVSNDELYNAYWNLPLITQVKHTGLGSIGALMIINEHQDCIKAAAEEFDIEKEMIEAVLFRELICVGVDDAAADIRFRITGQDCSTGLGQIRASTAIAAEKTVYGSCGKIVSQMWKALQDACVNIRYVAMNLKAIIMDNDLKVAANEDTTKYSSTHKVFARYNGTTLNSNTKKYADAVYKYYEAFKSLLRR